MDQDALKRIEKLEEEVAQLKRELAAIKQAEPKKMEAKEKPLTKYFFPDQSKTSEKQQGNLTQASQSEIPNVIEATPQQPAKPRKTFEQQFFTLLPKIFMGIFVLGVLWGLKLASDYGYFSDSFKIISGYALSIALLGIAFIAEKKQKLKEALLISLHGGAYIVGILTTAAGAILYDVLALTVALIIALIYIAYGIAMSYLKKTESLTVFVAFTSLLLPYLLDIMEFNPLLIAGYVVLLAIVLQIVIVPNKQKIAMYVSAFFGMVALIYLANMNTDTELLLSVALLIIFVILLVDWDRIITTNRWHIGLLYGFQFYALLGLIIIFEGQEEGLVPGIILFVIQGIFAYFQWRKTEKALSRLAFDATCAASMITILYLILHADLKGEIGELFALVAIFIGLMISIRLKLPLMKLSYTFLFGLTTLIIYLAESINGIWTLSHFLLLLALIFYIVAYMYAKRSGEQKGRLAGIVRALYVMDIIPVIIFAFAWSYTSKLDDYLLIFGTYEYGNSLGVLADLLLAVLIVIAFVLPRKWVGAVLLFSAAFIYAGKSLIIHSSYWLYNGSFTNQAIVRFTYIAVFIAIVLDIWRKGIIYSNIEKWVAKWRHILTIIITIFSLLLVFKTTQFFGYHYIMEWSIVDMLNTIALFIASISSMLIGKRYSWKEVNYTGIVLLVIALIKLIFFDLTNLDILVRSILFIVVGAVGLIVSNRLMKNE